MYIYLSSFDSGPSGGGLKGLLGMLNWQEEQERQPDEQSALLQARACWCLMGHAVDGNLKLSSCHLLNG